MEAKEKGGLHPEHAHHTRVFNFENILSCQSLAEAATPAEARSRPGHGRGPAGPAWAEDTGPRPSNHPPLDFTENRQQQDEGHEIRPKVHVAARLSDRLMPSRPDDYDLPTMYRPEDRATQPAPYPLVQPTYREGPGPQLIRASQGAAHAANMPESQVSQGAAHTAPMLVAQASLRAAPTASVPIHPSRQAAPGPSGPTSSPGVSPQDGPATSPARTHQSPRDGPAVGQVKALQAAAAAAVAATPPTIDSPRQRAMPNSDLFAWASEFDQPPSNLGFGGSTGGGPGEAWVRPVQAQPIGLPSPFSMAQSPGILFGPVAAALAKDLVKPELRGNFYDFALKFPLYIQQLSAGQALTDEVKLILLSSCLDPGAQLELQRRQELGERVRFQDFWNWLAQKYGGDVQASLREELRALRVQNDGKMTLAGWREFESRFRLVHSRLESPSEEEAQALVLQQLPDAIRRGIIREQARRGQSTPTARLRGIPGLTIAHVIRLAQDVIGQGEPVSATPEKDSFLIKLYSRRAMELLMARNGSLLAGGHQVKITPQEAKLSLDEVFRHAEDELRCQEKSDTFGRFWGGRGPVQNSEARRDFDVSGVSEIKIQDTKAPTSGMAARPSPEASSTSPSNFDSRYEHRASRDPQPVKGSGARPRIPSPTPYGRDHPPSPRGVQGKGKGKGPASIGQSSPKGGKGQGYGKAGGRRSSSEGSASRIGYSPSRERPCACCGAADHWARECPNKWCENCNVGGHSSRECTRGQPEGKAQDAPRPREATPPRAGSS